MKRLFALILLLIAIANADAQTTSLCFTNKGWTADVSLYFNIYPESSDLRIRISETNTDLDVCFSNKPIANSINVELCKRTDEADKSIYIAATQFGSDKRIYYTTDLQTSDLNTKYLVLGFPDKPSSSTKNIYIKGVDHHTLTLEQKISILYSLGLITAE